MPHRLSDSEVRDCLYDLEEALRDSKKCQKRYRFGFFAKFDVEKAFERFIPFVYAIVKTERVEKDTLKEITIENQIYTLKDIIKTLQDEQKTDPEVLQEVHQLLSHAEMLKDEDYPLVIPSSDEHTNCWHTGRKWSLVRRRSAFAAA
ncbi:unnamed protein product [Caenorhabditis nigoni]